MAESMRRQVVGTLAVATPTALLILSLLFYTPESENSASPLATPVPLEVDPPSIPAGRVSRIVVRTKAEAGENAERFRLLLSELEVDQEVSLKDLKSGVALEAKPDKVGLFTLKAMQKKVVRGSVAIASHKDVTLGADDEVQYELIRADDLRATDAGGLFVEMFVTARSEGKLLPPSKGTAARVFERVIRGSDKKGVDETVLFVGGRTKSVWVSLDPQTDVSFGAEIVGSRKGNVLNTLPISWKKDGPKLAIMAEALRPKAYATGNTPCTVAIQVSFRGVRIVPASYPISATVPDFLGISPESPMFLDKNGLVVCSATSTKHGKAAVAFGGPSADATSVGLEYASILWFQLLAICGGVVAGLVFRFSWSARSGDLIGFLQSNWVGILGRIIVSGVAAFFFSLAVVYGFEPSVGLTERLLTESGALLIGAIGGVLGENVFNVILPLR